MKQLKIANYCIMAMCILSLYNISINKNQIQIMDSDFYIINIIISWTPLLLFLAIVFIYSFFMCSKKLLPARKNIYISSFSQLIILTIDMLPIHIHTKINWIIWDILVIILFTICEICNEKMKKFISFKDFSLDEELKDMEAVKKLMEQNADYKYSKRFNITWFFYAISYSFSLKPIIFSIVVLVISIYAFYNLYCYRKVYVTVFGVVQKKDLITYYILFWILITAGILLYSFLSYKFPSFIVLLLSSLPKYIWDNKYAMEMRDRLKK